MGLVRLFLAVCVIATHSAYLFGYPLIDGNTAIEVFYVLSGFLISLVINRVYKSRTRDFYMNRITKIYPAYIAALLFSLLWFRFVYNSHHNPFSSFKELDFADATNLLYILVINLLLLGTDTTRYTTIGADDTLNFLDFANSKGSGAHNLLFVPQAWTISIELLFYLLAPFLVRNRNKAFLLWILILLLVVEKSALSRFNALNIPIQSESISIFQIKFFLIGAFAAIFVKELKINSLKPRNSVLYYIQYTFFFLFVIILGYQISFSPLLGLFILMAASTFILPKLYSVSLNTRWDKYLGDLSYPCYIFHYPFAKTLDRWLEGNSYLLGTLIATLFVSVMYQRFQEKYIEVYRWRIRNAK